MDDRISIVIPAYNEEMYLKDTLFSLCSGFRGEIIVVDDGSNDRTEEIVKSFPVELLKNPYNMGKGKSMERGALVATKDILVFLDGDLGSSILEFRKLLRPILSGNCNMAIAGFTADGSSKGFGIVKRFSKGIIARRFNRNLEWPLSGQRAMDKECLKLLMPFKKGFGVEIGMTLRALELGLVVTEVPTSMTHRVTGKDIKGFYHRGKQFFDILKAIY